MFRGDVTARELDLERDGLEIQRWTHLAGGWAEAHWVGKQLGFPWLEHRMGTLWPSQLQKEKTRGVVGARARWRVESLRSRLNF